MASEEVIKSWTKPDGTCDMVYGALFFSLSLSHFVKLLTLSCLCLACVAAGRHSLRGS